MPRIQYGIFLIEDHGTKATKITHSFWYATDSSYKPDRLFKDTLKRLPYLRNKVVQIFRRQEGHEVWFRYTEEKEID
jgi:hypothetical protein